MISLIAKKSFIIKRRLRSSLLIVYERAQKALERFQSELLIKISSAQRTPSSEAGWILEAFVLSTN